MTWRHLAEALAAALAAACLAALLGTLGCQVPTGARPSSVVVYGERGRGTWAGERSTDFRVGASVEFEFTYEEDED